MREQAAGRTGRVVLLAVPGLAVGVLSFALTWWAGWTSDSVAQQSLVRTWLDVGHGTAFVPVDTWIVKLPLYAVVEWAPLSPLTRLAVDVTVLQVVTFALLAFAVGRLARFSGPAGAAPGALDVAVPLLWLATLSGDLAANRLQPNYRNVELGLCFVGLALAAQRLDGPPDGRSGTDPRGTPGWLGWSRWLGAVTVSTVAATLLWVDDPYFAVLVGVPFALAALGWFVLRRRERRFLWVSGLAVLSLALTPLLFAGLARLGLQTVPGAAPGPHPLLPGLPLLPAAVGAQLGLADSDPAGAVPGTGWALAVPAAVLTAVLAAVAVLAGLALAREGWRGRRLLPVFVGLHWLVVVAGFVAGPRVSEVAHGRYLILGVYDLGVGLAVSLPLLRRRRPRVATALVGLLLAGAALNAAGTLVTAPDGQRDRWDRRPANEAGPAAPPQEAAVRRAVAATGLRRGYAEFWTANITYYRTGGRVAVNAVTCREGRLVTPDWLTDTARRTTPAPEGTFVVWQPSAAQLSGCDEASVQAVIGRPDRRVGAGPAAELWVYQHDVGVMIPAVPYAVRAVSAPGH